MKDRNEICTISFAKNSMDDDYTFYDDGTIERTFDTGHFSVNKKETLTAKNLDADLKEKLINKCDPEHVEKVKAILYATTH